MDRSVIFIFELIQISDLVFFGLAGLTIAGAMGTALSQNIVYSAFSLLASLFGVASLFAWLAADYLAITQLIVYIGGVLVLFLFAVMLTYKIKDVKHSNPITNLQPALLIATGLGGLMVFVATQTPWKTITPTARETTALVGDALLSQYLLPFEVLSLLILAALVGAVMMARKEIHD